MRRRMTVTLLLLAATAMPQVVIAGISRAATPTPQEQLAADLVTFEPFITTDAGRESITVGSVISDGAKQGDLCHFEEESTVGFSTPDNQGPVAFAIRIGTDDNCDMVVESMKQVESDEAEAPKAAATSDDGTTSAVEPLSAVSHRGWTFHTVFEYVNRTVNEERVKLTYTRNG